jgi:APA family basic amino acid/polyamine antiporter
MKRLLGLGFGLAVVVGGTIGIGILRTPGIVAGALPSVGVILAVWLLGGLYTLLGAVCLTELGAMMPVAGGYFVYARRAFGNAVGLAVGWTDWLTYASALGYVSIGMAEFTGRLVPDLAPHVRPTAIAILVGFVALQWAGLKVSSTFQTWTTAVKAVVFLALVAAGLLVGDGGATTSTAPVAAMTLAGTIAALQAVVITFGGWQGALYFTEEDTDPARHLPRAMIGGVAAVIFIYLLVNVALLHVLPLGDMAHSTLAAATAAERIAGPVGGKVITVVSLISLPPLLNALMMIGTRIIFALGRDGLFWSGTARVDARGTIGVGTLLTTGLAVALIATGTFERLVAMTSLFLAVNYLVCCAALVRLRRTAPGDARPFRAWGYPWSAAIVIAGAAAFVVGALMGDPVNGQLAIGLIGLGLVAGIFIGRTRGKPARGPST